MEPESMQDKSGLLGAASILIASEEFDGPVDAMGFKEYAEIAEPHPESISSKEDYDDIQYGIGTDAFDPQKIEDTWNFAVSEQDEVEDLSEKSGHTAALSSKRRRPGNVGRRYGVPTYEFPVECRRCNENPRIEGSMYCPECHPDRNADEVDDEEVLGKYDYDYHTDKVEETQNDNPSRHEMNKEFSFDVYRVISEDGEIQEGFDGNLLAFAVDFPNSDVYVEWNNDVFPDPLDDGHVSIYSSLEDLRTATDNDIEFVESVSQPDSINKQSVEGHPNIPTDNTAPEAVEFLERMEREGYDPSEEDEALLYELLGTGTPEWKMSKEDAAYKQEPEGSEICANCQYYYEGTDAEGVCSKVRGEVYPEHWCRLWVPGDKIQGKSDKAKRAESLFGRNESNSNTAQTGDNQFDKFLSGFGGYPKETRDRGAQLGNEHIQRLDDAFREQVWPDELQKSPSWTEDDDVTADTKEWVKAVLEMEDPIYDEYSSIPQSAGLTVKQELEDALEQSQGWSIDSIQSRIENDFPQLEEFESRRIARQEVAGVLNRSKIVSLMSRPDDPIVDWVGPEDADTTNLCSDFKDEVDGGVPFSEFIEKLESYAREYTIGTPDRVEQGLPHFLCRHTIEMVEE